MNKEYNFALLRILSMVGIICLHSLGSWVPLTVGTGRGVIIDFINTFCYMAINIFGLLTGYFGILGIKRSMLIRRMVQVLFYCLLIVVIYNSIWGGLTTDALIEYIFPITNGRLWYFWSYSFCFAISPSLNLFLKGISKKKHFQLICVCFVSLSLLTTLLNVDYLRIVHSGYSAVWLIFLYIVGAYIRNYGFFFKLPWYICIIIIVLNTILIMHSKYFLASYDSMLWSKSFLYSYSNPMILANGYLAFMLFSKQINIKFTLVGKVIWFLSKVSFAVYLIHANPLVLDKFFYKTELFSFIYMGTKLICVLSSLIMIIGVYFICALIETLREQLFRLVRINYLCDKADNVFLSVITYETE